MSYEKTFLNKKEVYVFIVYSPGRCWDFKDDVKEAVSTWLVWLSGLSGGLQAKGSPVRFPFRTHAWVEGQVPSGGCARQPHMMFLSLSFSFPSPLSKNK